jgi:lipopolysaccharide/colanic/teichoic acid biosynthesis glycosyltransferase
MRCHSFLNVLLGDMSVVGPHRIFGLKIKCMETKSKIHGAALCKTRNPGLAQLAVFVGKLTEGGYD